MEYGGDSRGTKDSGGGGDAYHHPGNSRPMNETLSRAESNRTLLDIIRDEGGGQKDSKKTWKHFKDKLRRHNSGGRGSTWTSTVPVPASDIPINNNNNNRMISRHPSARISPGFEPDAVAQPDISAVSDLRPPSLIRNRSRASGRFDKSGPSSMKMLRRENNYDDEDEEEEEAAEEEEGGGGGGGGGKEEQGPVRMSLMSLLADDDDETGLGYMMDEDDDDDEDDGGGVEYNSCCVCMVRHKGTAFEPCGHSFCRLCSREMWVDRGNCPLCNNYILEILDIF